MPPKILLTGASGQVGQVLYNHLIDTFGEDAIVASDINQLDGFHIFEYMDISDEHKIREVIQRHKITQIYHLAAILSAKAEQNPTKAWHVNMTGLLNILQAGVRFNIDKIFYPSSIAVFGNHTSLDDVDQFSVQHPTTLYGISKSAGENWCQYYHEKYNLDIRSLRYPGIIGYTSEPGGGTTDYAVQIYHDAITKNQYTCYIEENTILPMIYMDDAMRATSLLMAAESKSIRVRTSYNIQAISFSPKEIVESIRRHIPSFSISYEPDFRQSIANNWPRKLSDKDAQIDFQWKPEYNLEKMTAVMLQNLNKLYKK